MSTRWLVTIAIAIIGIFGCQSPTTTPSPRLIVDYETADERIGLAREDESISVLVGDGHGGMFVLTKALDGRGSAAVHLATFGGESGRAINSVVFGTAPPEAVSVQVTPEAVEVPVVDGLFIAGLRVRDLHPRDLHWRFLALDGRVLLEGVGLLE